LVGGPPGIELHTVVDGLPSGDTGDMVPVVLPMIDVEIVPNGVPEAIEVDDIVVVEGVIVDALTGLGIVDGVGAGVAVTEDAVGTAVVDDDTGTVEPGTVDRNDEAGCADSCRNGAVVLLVAGAEDVVGVGDIVDAAKTGVELTDTVGVPGAICPVGGAQVTTVPGVVGSEASGTGASVVSGTPDWVVAENGLGPLSGDVTIAPGVVGRPIAVLPMVETCAMLALQPASRIAVVYSKYRIAIPPRCAPP
jgi:hypothetical protein